MTRNRRRYVTLAVQNPWSSRKSSNLFRYISLMIYPIYYCLSFLHFPDIHKALNRCFLFFVWAHTYFSCQCL